HVLSGLTVNNAGTFSSNMGGTYYVSLNNTTFNNSGTYSFLTNGDRVRSNGGIGTFNNTGLVQNGSGVSGTSFFNSGGTLTFNNTGGGTLDATAGSMSLLVDGTY